jgi:hypothetical protein
MDWLNLNGAWQFRFDPLREGEEQQWYLPRGPNWRRQIIVPFCWESLAAWGEGEAAGNDHYYSTNVFLNPLEVDHSNHRTAPRYEVGWYRRAVRLPRNEPWRSQRIILHVGAADFFTDCWCNGVHLGRHEGGYTPFEFDLTDALEEDEDEDEAWIVLRVEDPMDHHEQPVGKQWGWYTTTSGIWQTVYLEPRPRGHIDSSRVLPDIDHARAHFEIFVGDVTGSFQVELEIIPPEAPSFKVELKGSAGMAQGEVDVSPMALWDTVNPNLYKVVMVLRDGDSVDTVHGYFGMRRIAAERIEDADAPAMLCLNNQPIYLRGVLYQSYFPDGVYTASNAATLRNDVLAAKDAGFDFMRIHIKLDDPLLLYYADTLGMLVMQDFPNFGEGGDTPLGRRRFEEMMLLGMKRDFNHPSIIAWCIFNESWGFGGQNELMKGITPGKAKASEVVPGKVANLSSFEWIHQTWELAKTVDPTRLIEDMSVVEWEHLDAYGHVDTDINSWHFYINDYSKAREHIGRVVAESYHGSGFNYIAGKTQRNVPLINSEYGGVGALDGDQDISWSFRFLTNELRIHGELSAYIFTQMTDVEWERNGFLRYDRTRKDFGYHPGIVNQGDVVPIDAPPIAKGMPGEVFEVPVLSSHFSRRERHDVTLQWILSGMDPLGLHHPELARGSVPLPFSRYRAERAVTLELRAPELPMLCTLSVAAVSPVDGTIATNYIQRLSLDGPLPLIEEADHSVVLRRRVWEWRAAEWSHGHCEREEGERWGFCYGRGTGYFEWAFNHEALKHLAAAKRMRILFEVSSRKEAPLQTSADRHPSGLELQVNGITIHRSTVVDHPHDSRGSLSYLRGVKGAYGYPIRAVIENQLLQEIAETTGSGELLVRLQVAPDFPGGLTIYDYDCGRFPFGPTIWVEYELPHDSASDLR